MAKSRRNKPNVFHEALNAAPRLLGATTAHPEFVFPPRLVQFWHDIPALFHDTLMYSGKMIRLLGNRFARFGYALLLAAIIIGGVGTAAAIAVDTFKTYSADLGNPSMIMNKKNTGTTITDRNGEVLFQGYGAVDRSSIPFEEMPESIKQATLATEDPDFYNHAGFSWKGTARAAYQDIMHTGKVQGGSTITQQLVKNTLLSNEKSFTRKYKEVLLSMDMERRYRKDQLLQMYLNTIYYGQGAYGIEAAAETYFHKPAKDLTLEESALLAGLPQSPSRYDPNISLKAATERRNYVLDRMQERGYVSPAQTVVARQQPVVAGTREVVLKAPHFVFYVLDQLRQQYGEDMIENGGITVRTSLDYGKQVKAEEIVRSQIGKLAGKNVTNGGLVSIDPTTGDIVSMVGSVDYNQPEFGAVNVTLAQLQPGSSFKPIAYLTAFSKGWNGATKVDDKPMSVPQGDGTAYTPNNYDMKFRGPVTLRRALANSLNIPAIEVLKFASIHDTISMAHTLGIQQPSLGDENRYGLSLVLGGGEVRPIDMARVYASFANQGTTVTPQAITRINDRFGKDITKRPPTTAKKAVDSRLSYMITNILSDNKSRIEEFGENTPLKLSRPAAVKTGTTNDFRDNWTVGYTPDLVTAVWVGNNNHSPMVGIDGITGAAPIWHDYMEMAHAGLPVHDFPVPEGVVFAKVCSTDGGLVDDKDPNGTTEVFLAEQKPTQRCGWAGGSSKPVPSQPQPRPATPAPNQPQPVTAQAPALPATPGMGGGGDPGKPEDPPAGPPVN